MSKVEIEKINQILSSLWKKEDFDGDRVTYNQALQDVQIALDSLSEEPTSNDLEEEIERHIKECLNIKFPTTDIELIKKDVRYTAERFAQWQKKQMMSKAVEREVKVDAGGYPYIDATELYDYDKEKPTAKKGDKVKVLIIREE